MLIDSEATYKVLCEEYPLLQKEYLRRVIDKVPSAERKGKWISDWGGEIKMIDGCPDGSCHCSYCGEWLVASDEYAVKGIYCPNCGARMEGEQNER